MTKKPFPFSREPTKTTPTIQFEADRCVPRITFSKFDRDVGQFLILKVKIYENLPSDSQV